MSSYAVKQLYCVLTEKCNLNCSFCIRGDKSDAFMDYDLFVKHLLPEHKNWNTIILTGGEPFLHKRFYAILRQASLHFKNVVVATNGTVPVNIRILKSIGLENVIFQISVDGNVDAHEAIRGQGNYKRTFDTIRTFDENKINYCVSTVVNKENYHTLLELVVELDKLKNLKYWKLFSMMPHGAGSLESCMTSKEWNMFVDEILSFCPFKVVTQKLYDFDLYEKVIDDQVNLITIKNCGSGNNKIYVYPDLEVFPCTCLKDFPMGNLRYKTITGLIDNSTIRYDVKDESVCKHCKYVGFCNGGCPGMSLKIFKGFGYGDIRCSLVANHYHQFKCD